MAEYYPLLAKAVASLPESTPEARRAIYDRARNALIGQLRATQPPIPEADIQTENRALDEAVTRLEAECAARTAPPARAPLFPPLASQPPSAPPASKPIVPPPPPPPVLRPGPQRPPAPGPVASETNWPAAPRYDTAPAAAHVQPPAAGPGYAPLPPIAPPASPPPSLQPPVAYQAPPSAPAPLAPPSPPPVSAPLTPPTSHSVGAAMDRGDASQDQASYWRRFGQSRDTAPYPGAAPAIEAPQEPVRPIAPPATRAPRQSRTRALALLIMVVAVAAGVGLLAYKLRDDPAEFSRGRPPAPVAETSDPSGGPKIIERIDSSSAPSPAPAPATQPVVRPTPTPQPAPQPAPPRQTAEAPRQPAPPAASTSPASLPVGQRAALLVEAPEEPNKVKTWYGNVAWTLEKPANGGLPVLRADVNIAEARLAVTFTVTRNADPRGAATHIVTVRFTPGEDGAVPGVAEIETPAMRIEDRAVGDALEGRAAPVTLNYFFIGLIRDQNLTARNLELLRGRAWIDVPMKLTSGKIAKVTFEKGPQGENLFNEAFEAWK